MQKKKELFRPEDYKKDLPPESTVDFGERGKGQIYVWDEKTVFAVQVAQITERPLLLRGPAGSGKSSLAPFVAITLDHAFYPFTVTARTQARDMLWGFDALGRLNDANVSRVDEDAQKRVTDCRNYLTPGPLWWAFDPQNASRRGTTGAETSPVPPAKDPAGQKQSKGAVVLIDEIDKADPDVPNNLLEVLGSHRFTVHETGDVIRDRRSPLVIITTNEERELPGAFLRRCVVLHLTEKTATSWSPSLKSIMAVSAAGSMRPWPRRWCNCATRQRARGIARPARQNFWTPSVPVSISTSRCGGRGRAKKTRTPNPHRHGSIGTIWSK
ncbi:AAA family ATPase [Desulfosarcina cetonica]|uniref:AAA family ATPase n=1 Tax=Desulfosarcina cetonica TaxID=90730 RepID=UPI0006CFCBB6|nr:MoxR family ATPase [Desulfosarcina cetonica]